MINRKLPSPSERGVATIQAVAVLGIVISIGGSLLISTTHDSLIKSVKQEKARDARAAAENGYSVTKEALNRKYNELLANCYYTDISDIKVDNSCSNGVTGIWNDSGTRTPLGTCDGKDGVNYPDIEKTYTDSNTKYIVNYYAFSGSKDYGGKGTLQVTGQSLGKDNQTVIASTTIRKTFDVNFTPCSGGNGFPGLYGSASCNLGGNDIIGVTSGNVMCPGSKRTIASCLDTNGDVIPTCNPDETTSRNAIGANNVSTISGKIYLNDIQMPRVPLFPANASAYGSYVSTTDYLESNVDPSKHLAELNLRALNAGLTQLTINPISITTTTTITTQPLLEGSLSLAASSGDSDGDGISDDGTSGTVNDYCFTLPAKDTSLITHCKVDNISLTGQKVLTVDTTHAAVRLYVEGDVSAGGRSGIRQVCTDLNDSSGQPLDNCQRDPLGNLNPARLALFGLPRSTNPPVCDETNQDFYQPTNLSTYLQDVTISGVSKPIAAAASLFAYFPCGTGGINGGGGGAVTCDPTYECGGGDVTGAIWLKQWNASNANGATLVVPQATLSNWKRTFGEQFAVSIKKANGYGMRDYSGAEGLAAQ